MKADWNKRFMELVRFISQWSLDPKRKVGSVIVDDDHMVISMGYNGIPRNCDNEVPERNERPTKYLYYEHAERNALYHAARHGVTVKGCNMYVTDFPCADCARGIIQAGIKRLIAPQPSFDHERWGESWAAAEAMLVESGVNIIHYNEENK